MILFEQIIEDREYRERVIKYFRLPARVSVSKEKFMSVLNFIEYTNPDFLHEMMGMVESDFNKEAYEQSTDSPDFSMEHILEPIVDKFKSDPKWQEFIKQDNSDVLAGYEGVTDIHGLYAEHNDGKHFLSIDLRAANWQSLQTILGFQESYEELIAQYTDNKIPLVSKTVRTKITGMLGAKEIMYFNKKLLKINQHNLLKSIFKHTGVNLVNQEPFAFYADEILMEIDESTLRELQELSLDDLENKVFQDTNIKVHLTPFTLKWMGLDKGCFKLYKNHEYDILNLSKDTLLIFNKLGYGLKIEDIDLEGIKLKGLTKEEYIKKVQEKVDMLDEVLV